MAISAAPTNCHTTTGLRLQSVSSLTSTSKQLTGSVSFDRTWRVPGTSVPRTRGYVTSFSMTVVASRPGHGSIPFDGGLGSVLTG